MVAMSQMAQVKCPACQRKGDWFAGPYGPFCSHRCKLVDLGKWFGEEHVVSQRLKSGEVEGAIQNEHESPVG